MNDLLHAPGFLGTNANFAADLTLVIMLLVAALFSFGFYLARSENFNAHKWVQTSGALLNLIMVLWMMVLPFRDFIIQDQGGPRERFFYIVTALHALIGLSATIFGLFVVLRGHNLMPKFLRFNNYKPFMRTAYTLYLVATLVGVAVYLVWFVFTKTPPTYG
jgi:uncharacterized membrane protein YozB (DUF420 family)